MSSLHGFSFIAGSLSNGNTGSFQAISPIDLATLPGDFKTASEAEIHLAMEAAHQAFATFRATDGETRARLLESIADEIEALGTDLIDRARLESGLPEPRLLGERGGGGSAWAGLAGRRPERERDSSDGPSIRHHHPAAKMVPARHE